MSRYYRKRSLGQGNIFTGVCLAQRGDVHGSGVCMAGGAGVAEGMHSRGWVWQRVCMACMTGGMNGRGACVAGGRACRRDGY